MVATRICWKHGPPDDGSCPASVTSLHSPPSPSRTQQKEKQNQKSLTICRKIFVMSSSSSSSYEKNEIRNRNPNPKASVLLVIDMQNYFYSMAKPIIPAITTTIDLCRSASVPIIFTRHRHKSPEDYGMLYEWWNGDLIMDGTFEAELIDHLVRRDGDLVVEKNTYSAFSGTNLEEMLKKIGVEEVIVSGVMTNLCCETTAREAFIRGFRVFFSTDATATSSAELREATLKNMAYGFAYLVDCKRIKEAFFKS